MSPEQMNEINRRAKGDPVIIGQELVKIVNEQEAEIERLRRELADAASYVEAGKAATLEAAKREYYSGTCDDCSCCTTAQCAEDRCPTNSIGDSTCPCTCY